MSIKMENNKTKEELFLEKLLENSLILVNEDNQDIKITNAARQKFKCCNKDGYIIYLSYDQLMKSGDFNMQAFLKTNKSKALNIVNFIKSKDNCDYLNILNEDLIIEDSKTIKLECLLCEDVFDFNIEEFSKSKRHICACRDTKKDGQLEKIIKEISKINKNIEIIIQPYRGVQTKLECKCLNNESHKNFFSDVTHLRKGQGCPECKIEKQIERQKSSIEELKSDLFHINKNIIIISDEYINSDTHVKCRCSIDGHEWFATPGNLRQGYGCPQCNKPDFFSLQRNEINKKEWEEINAHVYLLKTDIQNAETFFKIGFSSKIDNRIKDIINEYKKNNINAKIEIIDTISCSKYQAVIIEKYLLEKFKECRYYPINYFKGETECFSHKLEISNFKHEKDSFILNQLTYIDKIYSEIGGYK